MLTRVFATGAWISRSAMHCGGLPENALSGLDMVLIRDAKRQPFIPAASLIGAARAFAGRYMMKATDYEQSDTGDRKPYKEPPNLLCLFGSRAKYASLLSASDAVLQDNVRTAIRDGVRIDPKNGLAYADASGGAKYDCEVLPAGARFSLAFELRLPDPLPPEANAAELLSVFGLVLKGFQSGEIRLGARTNRGYGAGKVESWSIRRISSPSHYVDWLKRDPNAGEELSIEQLASPEEDQRKLLEIEGAFLVRTSVLVRSGGSKAGDPDSVQLSEGGSAILPGTSLAGVLRHRCERIANTVCHRRADDLVTGMFGELKKEGDRNALKASRVRVEEMALQDGEFHVHTRVAIDRFTQGALETALFEEAPFWPLDSSGGHIRGLRIVLHPPRHDEGQKGADFETEAALLLMAFKDLWLGDLTVGGGAAVGRGTLRGVRAAIRHPELCGELEMKVQGPKVGAITRSGPEQGWEKIEAWCRKLRED
jgi:CRISPR/Cas system CSM-associated protein Csm3 (group 7 of RAMP superfamily)